MDNPPGRSLVDIQVIHNHLASKEVEITTLEQQPNTTNQAVEDFRSNIGKRK